jgi:hypothetical protein
MEKSLTMGFWVGEPVVPGCVCGVAVVTMNSRVSSWR